MLGSSRWAHPNTAPNPSTRRLVGAKPPWPPSTGCYFRRTQRLEELKSPDSFGHVRGRYLLGLLGCFEPVTRTMNRVTGRETRPPVKRVDSIKKSSFGVSMNHSKPGTLASTTPNLPSNAAWSFEECSLGRSGLGGIPPLSVAGTDRQVKEWRKGEVIGRKGG